MVAPCWAHVTDLRLKPMMKGLTRLAVEWKAFEWSKIMTTVEIINVM